ncbi:MAG: T9SS type A sorting domain-containing protein, partial [Fibrobacterota bacterium]|nr:T9SS type A sorting domain-containing protein [Fibrobacterota bacterium]
IKESQGAAKIEAYFHNGLAWSVVPVSGIQIGKRFTLAQVPANAKVVAVVERLQSTDVYVQGVPIVTGDKLIFAPNYVNDSIRHITHYCLELKSVNATGGLTPSGCKISDKKGILIPDTVSLEPNSAYLYRIQYFIGDEKISGRQFETLVGTRFNPKSVVDGNPDILDKAKHQWHLIGFPIGGPLSRIMSLQPTTIGSTEQDTTVVLRVSKNQAKSVFDTLKNWRSHPVKPGDAFFMASAHPIKTTLVAGDTALPLSPFPITPDTGWNFIANPFPTNMALAKIRSVPKRPLTFHRLVTTIEQKNGEASRTYSWAIETVSLRGFYGYAFYSVPGEQLIFDPLADTASATPAIKTASAAPAAELHARISSPWGASAATLSSMPGQINIPFLPTPASGPQLRLGGKGGYMIKAVSDPSRIDEAMEIRSPAKGTASFTLTTPLQAGMAMRLIDLGSGKVYDEAGARNLSVSEGSRSFRLIAGDESFVEARTRSFRDAAPREIGISQNYPNPFRGRTKVELQWPVWNGGARKAVLEVIDVQGRIVERINLGEIRVGRQLLTLDASGWSPGIYLYRLTVNTGERPIRLQKRMLVSQ